MNRGIALAGVLVLTAPGAAHAELGPTTTINGAAPPGVMAKLVDISVLLDKVSGDGKRLLVVRGIRKPGTRAPIRVHDFGGHSCVMSGTMTAFIEGSEPTPYPAGSCYYMTPAVPMTAVNLGTEDVELVDTFELPPEAPAIIVLEPGWPDLSDPTG